MKDQGIAKKVIFQGSSYEGVKTVASDLEFDCLIVLEGMAYIDKDNYPPGYKKLLPSGQGLATLSMCEGNYLSPNKIRNKFQSVLQKSINALGRSGEMKLRIHGPAVQIDVYRGDSGCLWYSVDMVPVFQVDVPDGYHVYVGKSYTQADFVLITICMLDPHLTWRRSFSIEERQKLKEWNGGCKKMVVRMVKVLREVDPALKPLESYLVKTIVMNIERDKPCEWSVDHLAARFIDVLNELMECLFRGYLSHHFLSGNNDSGTVNLLQKYDREVLNNMAERLKGLLNDQQKLRKVLKRGKPTPQQTLNQNYLCNDNIGEISISPVAGCNDNGTREISISPAVGCNDNGTREISISPAARCNDNGTREISISPAARCNATVARLSINPARRCDGDLTRISMTPVEIWDNNNTTISENAFGGNRDNVDIPGSWRCPLRRVCCATWSGIFLIMLLIIVGFVIYHYTINSSRPME